MNDPKDTEALAELPVGRQMDYLIAKLRGDEEDEQGWWVSRTEPTPGHEADTVRHSDEDGGPLHYSTEARFADLLLRELNVHFWDISIAIRKGLYVIEYLIDEDGGRWQPNQTGSTLVEAAARTWLVWKLDLWEKSPHG